VGDKHKKIKATWMYHKAWWRSNAKNSIFLTRIPQLSVTPMLLPFVWPSRTLQKFKLQHTNIAIWEEGNNLPSAKICLKSETCVSEPSRFKIQEEACFKQDGIISKQNPAW